MLASSTRRLFSTTAKTQQYFLVNYEYVQDAYYKRIPHRDAHEAHLQNFINQADAKVVSAPSHPHESATFFIETNAASDPTRAVEAFVKADPYVTKGIAHNYSIKPIAITHKTKDWERIAADYLMRA